MNNDKYIEYWVETAEKDFHTMLNLYKSQDYHWCLFIGHLVIEKLLKALYVYKVGSNPPQTHDLLRLAEKSGLTLEDDQKDSLDIVTTFHIAARYPDYKQSFYQKCTKKYTTLHVNKIKEMREWLLTLLKPKLNK